MFAPISAIAGTIYCSGEITNTYVSSGASLYVKGTWRNDYMRLCNLTGTVNNTNAITCSMWASYAATAMTNKKQVKIAFADNGGVTCANMGTYSNAPKVIYVMLTKTDIL